MESVIGLKVAAERGVAMYFLKVENNTIRSLRQAGLWLESTTRRFFLGKFCASTGCKANFVYSQDEEACLVRWTVFWKMRRKETTQLYSILTKRLSWILWKNMVWTSICLCSVIVLVTMQAFMLLPNWSGWTFNQSENETKNQRSWIPKNKRQNTSLFARLSLVAMI